MLMFICSFYLSRHRVTGDPEGAVTVEGSRLLTAWWYAPSTFRSKILCSYVHSLLKPLKTKVNPL